MRVCKHRCDVNMFCFSCAIHTTTNSNLTRQLYFIYLFPRRLKLVKSLQNMLCQLFFAQADIFSEKYPYFGKPLFCKTRTDYACKTSRLGKISLLISAITKSFSFFHGRVNL